MSSATHECPECGKEFDKAQSVRAHQNVHKTSDPYKDAERIKELYYGEQLSMRDVARELDCSLNALQRWMNRFGIERRSNENPPKSEWLQKPPKFTTDTNGYEIHRVRYGDVDEKALLHRLLAVAEYGFDAVKGKEVHHKSRVEWDNRPSNLELLTPSEHKSIHAPEAGEYNDEFVSKKECGEIQSKYPDKTQAKLAKEYGYSPGQIHYHAKNKCQH